MTYRVASGMERIFQVPFVLSMVCLSITQGSFFGGLCVMVQKLTHTTKIFLDHDDAIEVEIPHNNVDASRLLDAWRGVPC